MDLGAMAGARCESLEAQDGELSCADVEWCHLTGVALGRRFERGEGRVELDVLGRHQPDLHAPLGGVGDDFFGAEFDRARGLARTTACGQRE
jgi:hypothetical protein